MNDIICEKCGTIMKQIDPKNHCGVMCPKCGWGWATTSYDPMADDETDYDIILLKGNVPTQKTIKVISHITGQNYVNAKKTIENSPIVIFTGKALQIQETIQELNQRNILYKITPNYPY